MLSSSRVSEEMIPYHLIKDVILCGFCKKIRLQQERGVATAEGGE